MYSFINVFGLTIGIASCILIGLYITDEISFDKFNTNAGSIARMTMQYSEGSTTTQTAVTGTKAGPQLKRTFSFIEDFARLINTTRVVKLDDKLFTEKKVLYADSPFFKMFSFHLLSGNPSTVLNAPNKVVLTQSISTKYFGTSDPVGKTLNFGDRGDYEVTGVCENAPGNSQIQFDLVASFSSLPVAKIDAEEWWTANYITYLKLQDNKNTADAEKQIDAYMRNTVSKEPGMTGSNLIYHLEPLLSVHLHSALSGLTPNGNINYIYIMLAIGILILAIACINYTNLATAQSASRLGEIGMRKVMGAQRWQLFAQFIGESIVITFIGLALAIFISIELLPIFNNITGKALTVQAVLAPLPIAAMLLMALLVSFIACAYPAFVLSGTGLSKILRSGFSFSKSGGGLRKSLIVVQFGISLFLVIATIIVQQQLHYMQNKDLGYDKDHLLVLPVDNSILKDYESYKAAINQIPGVQSVASAYETPTYIQWGDGVRKTNASADKGISVNAIPVDQDFVKTMKIHILAGSDFTRADLALLDTSNRWKNYWYSFIINESAVKQLGWSPQEAVGKTIYKNFPGTVKAVVQDFHFSSLHEPIRPLVIFLNNDMLYTMFVRVNGSDMQATIGHISALWKARVPKRPFEYHFLNDDYNKLYIAEQKTASIFSVFAGLAIILACLGLFGLAAFTVVQRTKEIGIRKVMGAGTVNIINLLCKEFLQLVGIAFVVAVPAGWLASEKWLQDFAYRINISWMVFLMAGAGVLLITLLTVGYHAVKAAMANPVKSLRTE